MLQAVQITRVLPWIEHPVCGLHAMLARYAPMLALSGRCLRLSDQPDAVLSFCMRTEETFAHFGPSQSVSNKFK